MTRVIFLRQAKVRIIVYNLLGQRVRTLVDEIQEAGYRFVVWDGKNDLGDEVASGMYIFQFTAPKFVKARKMILAK